VNDLDGDHHPARSTAIPIPSRSVGQRCEGFSVWNASVDLLSAHGLDVGIYAPTNVRSAHYFIGRPRTIGVRLAYKF
jgi:hypothetical protein